jgi:hypothetical protein
VQVRSPQGSLDGLAQIVVEANDPGSSPGAANAFLNDYTMEATVVNPQGISQVVSLIQVAPGKYSGKFLPSDTGAYLLQVRGSPPDTSQPAVSENTGWVLAYSPEYSQMQSDPDALLRLAAAANTARNPFVDPEQVFIHNLAAPPSVQDAWPWLLFLAAVLLPFDIGVRRLLITRTDLARAWEFLTSRVITTQEPAVIGRDERLEGLFKAKEKASQNLPPASKELPPIQYEPRKVDEEKSPVISPTAAQDTKLADIAKQEPGDSSVSQLLKSKRDRKKL